MIRKSLCGMTAEEILHLTGSSDLNFSHAVSVANSIYKKRIADLPQLVDIPKKLKEDLIKISYIGVFQPIASEISVDCTVKYLFRNDDELEYETVY